MKPKKLPTRRRAALQCILIAAVTLVLVNRVMGIGLLLPIQGIRQVEERQGMPRGAVIARDWAPEIHATRLVYLTASRHAVLLGDTYLSIYGWMGGFGWALDCYEEAPLHAGEMSMSRDGREGTLLYFYGRVDDPAIEQVTVSGWGWRADAWEEAFCLTAGPEDFLERNGQRYFLLRQEMESWTYDSGIHAWAAGYDGTGGEITAFEIQEGTHSYFG